MKQLIKSNPVRFNQAALIAADSRLLGIRLVPARRQWPETDRTGSDPQTVALTVPAVAVAIVADLMTQQEFEDLLTNNVPAANQSDSELAAADITARKTATDALIDTQIDTRLRFHGLI